MAPWQLVVRIHPHAEGPCRRPSRGGELEMAVARFGGAGRNRHGRVAGRAAVSAGYLDNALCLFKPFEMLAASESNWRVPDTESSWNRSAGTRGVAGVDDRSLQSRTPLRSTC
jgi:hypothetical protein